MEKQNKIKAYKGFKKDLTCRDFQYEEGKEYTHNGRVEACSGGFHACELPTDCFGYYAPGQSVFHEVELSGETSRGTDDTKIAASHIKVGARLDIAGICKAQFEFVKSRCTNEHNSEPGKPATAGNFGAATAGNFGAATSRGKSSSGENGLSVARGNNVMVRGGMGAVLVIAEEKNYNYDVKEWKAAVVDGERIKADTMERLPYVVKAVEMMKERGLKPYRVFVYVLVGPDVKDALNRINTLKDLGVMPFAQPYRDFENKVEPTQEQKDLARWCNMKATFKTCTFEEYNRHKI